jgi:hypothetical protein
MFETVELHSISIVIARERGSSGREDQSFDGEVFFFDPSSRTGGVGSGTSQAEFPIWQPACPTWMEMTSRMVGGERQCNQQAARQKPLTRAGEGDLMERARRKRRQGTEKG